MSLTDPLLGVDLSVHNPTTPNLAAYDVCIVKVFEASAGLDRRYVQHAKACESERQARPAFAWGMYCFLLEEALGYGTPEQQVTQAFGLAHLGGLAPQTFWLDWERDEGAGFPRPPVPELLRALRRLAALVPAGTDGIYASALAPYPELGQSLRWKAFYGGPTPAEPWDGFQYSGTGLDRSHWKKSILTASGIPEGTHMARFISASGYDPSSLPTIKIPAGSKVSDLAGNEWAGLPATSLYTNGLVDGHSAQRSVLIRTGRYFPDGVQRPVWQSVEVDPATPVHQPEPNIASVGADIPELG